MSHTKLQGMSIWACRLTDLGSSPSLCELDHAVHFDEIQWIAMDKGILFVSTAWAITHTVCGTQMWKFFLLSRNQRTSITEALLWWGWSDAVASMRFLGDKNLHHSTVSCAQFQQQVSLGPWHIFISPAWLVQHSLRKTENTLQHTASLYAQRRPQTCHRPQKPHRRDKNYYRTKKGRESMVGNGTAKSSVVRQKLRVITSQKV